MLRLCLIDGGGFDLVVCYRSFLRLVVLVVAFVCGFGFGLEFAFGCFGLRRVGLVGLFGFGCRGWIACIWFVVWFLIWWCLCRLVVVFVFGLCVWLYV